MIDGSTRPYWWMLGAALGFTLMGACAHELKESCPWQIVALARSGLALAFSAALAWQGGAKLVLWRPATLWVRSFAGTMSLFGTFFALSRLPIADVLTLSNMFPVWIALLSWPLLRERPGVATCAAIVCGVTGVVLVQQPHLAEGNYASLAALGASFTSAVAMLGLHRLQGVDPRAVVVHFSAVSAVCVAAAAGFSVDSGSLFANADDKTPWLLLGVGAAATFGQILLTKAFAAGQPAKVAVVGLSQIAFGMIFDAIRWQREFSSMTLLGIALVAAPTAWLMWRR